jgi:hypothetical protein
MRTAFYAISGLLIGLMIGVTVMSSAMIDQFDRIEAATNVYGLNTFLFGCIESRRSKLSCLDITRQNEKHIILPDSVEN